jgi:hypothetical protein
MRAATTVSMEHAVPELKITPEVRCVFFIHKFIVLSLSRWPKNIALKNEIVSFVNVNLIYLLILIKHFFIPQIQAIIFHIHLYIS